LSAIQPLRLNDPLFISTPHSFAPTKAAPKFSSHILIRAIRIAAHPLSRLSEAMPRHILQPALNEAIRIAAYPLSRLSETMDTTKILSCKKINRTTDVVF
jgi:hypothetical protein